MWACLARFSRRHRLRVTSTVGRGFARHSEWYRMDLFLHTVSLPARTGREPWLLRPGAHPGSSVGQSAGEADCGGSSTPSPPPRNLSTSRAWSSHDSVLSASARIARKRRRAAISTLVLLDKPITPVSNPREKNQEPGAQSHPTTHFILRPYRYSTRAAPQSPPACGRCGGAVKVASADSRTSACFSRWKMHTPVLPLHLPLTCP